MTRLGIDVSKHNGTIDWAKVKDAGVQFAFIRAGYGQTNIDAQADKNFKGAIANGIPVGVYWFSYAYSADMAAKEAKKCISVISKYNVTLPVFYDFEYDTVTYAKKNGVSLGKKEFNDYTVAFCDVIRDAGYTPGVYYNLDYYRNMVDSKRLSGLATWYAQYSSKCSVSGQDIWQYGSSGSVAGISGNCDMNYCYNDTWFNNTSASTGDSTTTMEDEDMTQETFNQMFANAINALAKKDPDNWSLDAREWAEGNGVINGDENGNKMYKKFTTREELAQILYNMNGNDSFQKEFDNVIKQMSEEAPSDWSASDREWAESNGIITGNGNGSMGYKSYVTKEQVVAIVHRALNSMS